MVELFNFFKNGYKRKWDKDVFHYLDSIANNDIKQQERGMSHRVVRAIIEIYKTSSKSQLLSTIYEIIKRKGEIYKLGWKQLVQWIANIVKGLE